jgi:hypothetical protein
MITVNACKIEEFPSYGDPEEDVLVVAGVIRIYSEFLVQTVFCWISDSADHRFFDILNMMIYIFGKRECNLTGKTAINLSHIVKELYSIINSEEETSPHILQVNNFVENNSQMFKTLIQGCIKAVQLSEDHLLHFQNHGLDSDDD